MFELSKRALGPDFLDKIFFEYSRDNQLNNLYYLLYNMGIIKRASYSTFGYSDRKYLLMSHQAKENTRRYSKALRDYRPQFSM